MIFQILKVRKMVKEGSENPGNFAGGQVADLLTGLFVVPIVIGVGVLILLFILSFTTLLGGPFGLAKFFFFVVLFGILSLGSFVWKLSKLAKRMTHKTVDETIKVTSEVIE